MSFYSGCYLILQESLEPKHDHDGWAFPTTVFQHMAETSNVEDLLIDPENMSNIPTQIQYGACLWTSDEGFTPDYNYDTFYVKTQEHFYVQGWTSGTALYSQFYVHPEFFYVQGWTSGTALYGEFYVREEKFYVQGWTSGTALYGEFYVLSEPFYVQGFTATDWFYPIDWVVC
jgi:hypothetical protein